MAKPSTIKAIYRCLLRDAAALEHTPHFRLRTPLKLEQWGVGHYVPPPLKDAAAAARVDARTRPIRSLQDYYDRREWGFCDDESTAESVSEMIRRAFKENMRLGDKKVIATKVDEAISALKALSEQLLLAQCSSITTTNGIKIEATSQHVPAHSNPEQGLYRFTYRITITNESETDTVQITGRQYTFESERGQRIALPRNSPGVVGNTPVLQPGQCFEYASGVDIDAPRGSATGCLHVIRRGNDAFSNDVNTFDAFVSRFHFQVSPS